MSAPTVSVADTPSRAFMLTKCYVCLSVIAALLVLLLLFSFLSSSFHFLFAQLGAHYLFVFLFLVCFAVHCIECTIV